MDYNLPGFSVHGISQARIYWNVLPFPPPGDLPDQPRDQTHISCKFSPLVGRFFTTEPPGKHIYIYMLRLSLSLYIHSLSFSILIKKRYILAVFTLWCKGKIKTIYVKGSAQCLVYSKSQQSLVILWPLVKCVRYKWAQWSPAALALFLF